MITREAAATVISAARSTGADFAELYMEDMFTNSVAVSRGDVEDASSAHRHGAGVRVFSGLKAAYAYTADTSLESLVVTAKAAAAAVKSDSTAASLPFTVTDYRVVPKIPFADVRGDQRVRVAMEAYHAACAFSQEIVQAQVRVSDAEGEVLVANSEGIFAMDRRTRMNLIVQAVASDGRSSQTGFADPGYGMGFEGFERLDPVFYAKAAANTAVTMLHAPECPAARLPVVIEGGYGGVIFHEACGHSLEASVVSRGNSEFCGKLGQQVANPRVTAVDDGTLPGEWGSLHMDDEGIPTRRNVLIENGILKGYLIDRLGSRRMNMAPTGNARRQDYTLAPTSRMTNTFIVAGADDDDEMIRTMPEGLYAHRLGGGSVNPLTGEFNFTVREGYWVKNGGIVTPVRGATLIGRGTDVLRKIDRVGKELSYGQGLCSVISYGVVPVDVGQPRIRVSELTIGGKGGAL